MTATHSMQYIHSLKPSSKRRTSKPHSYIIVGDLNAHNNLWRSNSTFSRGKTKENVINFTNAYLLNMGSDTHLNSSFDFPPSILVYTILNYLSLIIFLSLYLPFTPKTSTFCLLNKAYWKSFTLQTEDTQSSLNFTETIDDNISILTNSILLAAEFTCRQN